MNDLIEQLRAKAFMVHPLKELDNKNLLNAYINEVNLFLEEECKFTSLELEGLKYILEVILK